MANLRPDDKVKQKCIEAAAILKAIAHPQRLLLLCCLKNGEKTVSELESACGVGQSTVSQHLIRMRLEGIVECKRHGNFVYYQIKDKRVLSLLGNLSEIFCS